MRYAGGFVTKYGVDPTSRSSSASASGVWHLSDITKYQASNTWPTAGFYPAGETTYTVAGSYTFIVPEDVTTVSVVCVGPGHSSTSGGESGNTSFGSFVIAEAGGKTYNGGMTYGGIFYSSGTRSGTAFTGGGSGGNAGYGAANYGGGGGGAGGYSGAGGNFNSAGQGGAGGGGASTGGDSGWYASGGGGVGLFGQDTSGPAPTLSSGYGTHGGPGRPGSGGGEGTNSQTSGSGGDYGGGAGAFTGDGGGGGALVYGNNIAVTPGQSITVTVGAPDRSKTSFPANGAGGGAVRVIWSRFNSGITRIFPTTNVGSLLGDSPIVTPFVLVPAGQQEYTVPGVYSWVAPTGITTVSVVCVGGGAGGYAGSGGAGGELRYINNVSVTPGQSYEVKVGGGGRHFLTDDQDRGNASSFSSVIQANGGGIPYNWPDGPNTDLTNNSKRVAGFGGTGFLGGLGGYGNLAGIYGGGGGGAGGYAGVGGKGTDGGLGNATAGQGGAGGGGGTSGVPYNGENGGPIQGSGGGVGLLGEGSSGAAGSNFSNLDSVTAAINGGGGSGGSRSAKFWPGQQIDNTSQADMRYGGGGGSGGNGNISNAGASGAVRIIWAGNSGTLRAYPSTGTGNL
jgi:hypothetical protein